MTKHNGRLHISLKILRVEVQQRLINIVPWTKDHKWIGKVVSSRASFRDLANIENSSLLLNETSGFHLKFHFNDSRMWFPAFFSSKYKKK